MRSSAGVIAMVGERVADVGSGISLSENGPWGRGSASSRTWRKRCEALRRQRDGQHAAGRCRRYPGSSVAFAQLLSGMERSGLIAREVRGKRTYRIGLGPARTTGPGRWRPGSRPGPASQAGLPGVRPVPGTPGWPGSTTTNWPGGCWCRSSVRLAATEPEEDPPEASPAPDQPPLSDQLALQETVNGLEYELATAWTKHGKLAEENVRLREHSGSRSGRSRWPPSRSAACRPAPT